MDPSRATEAAFPDFRVLGEDARWASWQAEARESRKVPMTASQMPGTSKHTRGLNPFIHRCVGHAIYRRLLARGQNQKDVSFIRNSTCDM